jgi:hypothetical protein
VPKATVNAVVRAALSMSFILGAATVGAGGRVWRQDRVWDDIAAATGAPELACKLAALASASARAAAGPDPPTLKNPLTRRPPPPPTPPPPHQVVFNLKSRFCKEQAWQCEMQGNVTSQRRWEAYDKLGTFAIYTFTIFLSIQVGGRWGEDGGFGRSVWAGKRAGHAAKPRPLMLTEHTAASARPPAPPAPGRRSAWRCAACWPSEVSAVSPSVSRAARSARTC